MSKWLDLCARDLGDRKVIENKSYCGLWGLFSCANTGEETAAWQSLPLANWATPFYLFNTGRSNFWRINYACFGRFCNLFFLPPALLFLLILLHFLICFGNDMHWILFFFLIWCYHTIWQEIVLMEFENNCFIQRSSRVCSFVSFLEFRTKMSWLGSLDVTRNLEISKAISVSQLMLHINLFMSSHRICMNTYW